MLNKTILIVDDTIVNLDILVELLSDYDVIDTTNGKDALGILKEESVDLILLDIMMPEMDGFEVCKRLKENKKTKNIPVIFITAMTDEESIEKAYDIGGVDYVTKPFKPKELLARVRTQFHLKDLQNKELHYQKKVAIAELIHNIAHQWRQPLSAISTMASGIVIQKELGSISDEIIVENCERITDTVQYLSSIIEIFGDFFAEDTEITTLDIKELLHNNLPVFFCGHNDIDIVMDIEEELQIQSNKTHFLRAIHSLVQNSQEAFLEYSGKKIVFLRGYQDNNSLVLEFYDTAGGVKKSLLNRIFEPYFTTKHKSQGKGLGLYIMENIILYSLQGSVHVENFKFKYQKEDYKGLKFTIKLPLISE